MAFEKPLRILRIISSVDPRGGGPVEGMRRSSLALAEKGHHTEIVTLDEPGEPFLSDFPLEVHPQGKLIRKYGYTPRLARWIAEQGGRFDVAVVHGLWNHASVGGWQGLKRAGIPYVTFSHGMMDPWFKNGFPVKHLAKQTFWWLAQGKVLRDAHTVLFTTDEERRLAKGVYTGHAYRERVVAYAAAAPSGNPESQISAFRERVPALGDRRYLLFMSRIHPKKGVDLLVQAFTEVAALAPNIDLVIAGPDETGMIASLKQVIENAGLTERVHFPGMLQGDAKWGSLLGAKAFVLPSHSENFGIVVAEALASGCPVLITDKVNICNDVIRTQSGLVDEDTVEGTVRNLKRFLALSPDQAAAMSWNALAAYRDNFSVASAVIELESVLREAAEKK